MAELDEATQAAGSPTTRSTARSSRRTSSWSSGLDPGQRRGEGPRWQVPFPYEEGVDWTSDGDPRDGCAGRDGRAQQDPPGQRHAQSADQALPPVFVSSNASKETIEYCGPRGFIPTYFSKIERAAEFGAATIDAAAAAGRTYALGQNQALVRWGQMAETEEESRMVAEYDVDIFQDLYAGTTPMKFDPENGVDSVINSRACGSWARRNRCATSTWSCGSCRPSTSC